MNQNSDLRVPLAGYTDRLSVRPGESIAFKVSANAGNTDDSDSCAEDRSQAQNKTINSWLTRSICADPNPAGPGVVERDASHWYAASEHLAIKQEIHAGSYAVSAKLTLPQATAMLQMSAIVYATHLNGTAQCIMSFGSLVLVIDENNRLQARLGSRVINSEAALTERQWFKAGVLIACTDSSASLSLSLQDVPSASYKHLNNEQQAIPVISIDIPIAEFRSLLDVPTAVTIAASLQGDAKAEHFNGKIESPQLSASDKPENHDESQLISIAWDLSHNMSSTRINDVHNKGIALELINFPTRAMKGSRWNGEEMCWRHAPDQYAAIHFHDDDLVDAQWSDTFVFKLPDTMPSGVYVMHISDGEHEDAMPFFVCAPKRRASQKPDNKVCVLVSTFTYAIYGNHARPDWKPDWQTKIDRFSGYPHNPAVYRGYGLSTYNNHSDGSGICHASHLRPLFNLRPGYITFGDTACSGLRHFQADSHLLAWLDAMDIEFDVITDRELHDEGVDAINGYSVLLTGSHPEYHTAETLDALQNYRDNGGHLSYLGGNGFYWRIALHPEAPDTLEIRRAEAGIRAWAAEPGEYYHAFDGQYGGLWRRNARPPQALCGVGFSAQGQFHGSHYRRCNHDEKWAWLFEGIDDDVIGDFGLCGNGAAGYELDRADKQLGTPGNAVVLASSEQHSDDFMLVPEEMLTHITTLPGPSPDELIRADMVWFDTPTGGSVFSVGSITFCGSLPHNNFQNSVSRLLKNVVDHVLNQHVLDQ